MSAPHWDAIATPFPLPGGGIRRALDLLHRPAPPDPDDPDPIRPDDLPRPWDPASCPDSLRRAMWRWCDEVAEWINHEYCWRPDTMIPACWPAHPHIAHELPVLAVQRLIADQAADPHALEEWHRYTYPEFCRRMLDRLGESSCRTGRHIDWPAAARHAAFRDGCAARFDAIDADTTGGVGLFAVT